MEMEIDMSVMSGNYDNYNNHDGMNDGGGDIGGSYDVYAYGGCDLGLL